MVLSSLLRQRTIGQQMIPIFWLTAGLVALLLHHDVAATPTNQAGMDWLLAKKTETEAQLLPGTTGIYYSVREAGDGNVHPAFDSPVLIDYEIYSRQGTKLQSTRGADIPVKTLVHEAPLPAIQEALIHMVDADWWDLYITSEQGYNDGEALFVSLDLNSVLGGDVTPKGELYICRFTVDEVLQFKTNGNCNEDELEYIHKILHLGKEKGNRLEKVGMELQRLRALRDGKNMKADLLPRVLRRVHLLKQFPQRDARLCTLRQDDKGYITYDQLDCNYKEQEYITSKIIYWDHDKLTEEMERLTHLDLDSMDQELAAWVRRRLFIVQQVSEMQGRKVLVLPDEEQARADEPSAGDTEPQGENGQTAVEVEPQGEAEKPAGETEQYHGEHEDLSSEL